MAVSGPAGWAEIAQTGTLPVPLFCAGGLATPADAALAMQLGAEAVFVGSGIFKSEDPGRTAAAVDAAAGGTLFTNGCGAVLLKLLEDAVEDKKFFASGVYMG